MDVKLTLTIQVNGKPLSKYSKSVSNRIGILFEDTTLHTALEKAEEILEVAAPDEEAE